MLNVRNLLAGGLAMLLLISLGQDAALAQTWGQLNHERVTRGQPPLSYSGPPRTLGEAASRGYLPRTGHHHRYDNDDYRNHYRRSSAYSRGRNYYQPNYGRGRYLPRGGYYGGRNFSINRGGIRVNTGRFGIYFGF